MHQHYAKRQIKTKIIAANLALSFILIVVKQRSVIFLFFFLLCTLSGSFRTGRRNVISILVACCRLDKRDVLSHDRITCKVRVKLELGKFKKSPNPV